MMQRIAISLACALTVACYKSGADTASPADADAASPGAAPQGSSATDPVASQIDRGAELYGANCAGCHGSSGEGGKAPAVVGEGALSVAPPQGRKARTMEFHTVTDVFQFVKTAMPPNKVGTLTDDEIWAILAFDLKANGIELDAPLDATGADALRLDGA